MNYQAYEVSIHPYADLEDEDGEVSRVNSSAYDFDEDEVVCEGWSVCVYARNAQGGETDFEDEEHPDYQSAIARAEDLAEKYSVHIDHRY